MAGIKRRVVESCTAAPGVASHCYSSESIPLEVMDSAADSQADETEAPGSLDVLAKYVQSPPSTLLNGGVAEDVNASSSEPMTKPISNQTSPKMPGATKFQSPLYKLSSLEVSSISSYSSSCKKEFMNQKLPPETYSKVAASQTEPTVLTEMRSEISSNLTASEFPREACGTTASVPLAVADSSILHHDDLLQVSSAYTMRVNY